MASNTIKQFTSGVYNLADPENIPSDAAQSSLNWLVRDGKLTVVAGKSLLGSEGAVGPNRGLHTGYKVNGTPVLYQKINSKIQYYNGLVWIDVITGLTPTAEYVFSNYSSLSGTFTFATGVDGIFKLHNGNPGQYIALYNSVKNFKGFGLVDKGRMLMWNLPTDKTGFYGSRIDPQDATVYTTVTDESVGPIGVNNYTGTLAFKAGGATRNAFGVTFKGQLAAGLETFTDNYQGILTGSLGGTGTINYVTGAYNITFATPTVVAPMVSYQWEDSNAKGITDFTKSATRLPGEGFVFRQDEGGDAILSIQVGLDGAYYSLKANSVYRLALDTEDKTADNNVFRRDIGIPFFRSAVSSGKGIFFMNTANPQKPVMTILSKNQIGGDVEPVDIFPQFDFSQYIYDECVMDTYDKYVLVSCKTKNSLVNDTTLVCELLDQSSTVSPISYGAKTFAQAGYNFYMGSPITESVYQLFNGVDDDGSAINNYWIGKAEMYDVSDLKKFKKLRLKGFTDPNQSTDVYIDYDGAGFQYVGTISGRGSYVDYSSPQSIGSNTIGVAPIGGATTVSVSPFYVEFSVKTPKFRVRTIKFVTTKIGYFQVQLLSDWDIFLFEDRLPKRFRTKPISQNPSTPVASLPLTWDQENDTWDAEGNTWDQE